MSENKCRCAEWADASPGERQIRVLTGHHETCPMCCESGLSAALALIDRLTEGIEAWAADEDGVHPVVWEAYRQAKALHGVYLPIEQGLVE
jgi:hypothetical protein